MIKDALGLTSTVLNADAIQKDHLMRHFSRFAQLFFALETR